MRAALIALMLMIGSPAGANEGFDPTTSLSAKNRCAQDIAFCSDIVICWLAGQNKSKYLSEARRRKTNCNHAKPVFTNPLKNIGKAKDEL